MPENATMTRPDTTTAATPDTTVLRMACAGNQAAWGEIIHRYEGAVRAAVATYRPTSADAADAVQNTWLRLLEHAATIREPEKLGGWLRTTARRECLALVRRQRIERPVAMIDTNRPCSEPTPEAAAIITETRRHVRRATNALPTRPRDLIDALYYNPCGSYADIAHQMAMPIGSIGPMRRRTLHRLRRSLAT
jgi:RNA polymerase sigma factor (sigma-70 family)